MDQGSARNKVMRYYNEDEASPETGSDIDSMPLSPPKVQGDDWGASQQLLDNILAEMAN